MENWEKVIGVFIHTLKELRQCAGLEVVTQVGSRKIYRTDPAGITVNLTRIDSLLKFITEHYLIEEDEKEWTVEIYTQEDIEAILGEKIEPYSEEDAKEVRALLAESQD